MKANNELLLDIIYARKTHIELYIDELNDSLKESIYEESEFYKHNIEAKEEELNFLKEIKTKIKKEENCLDYMKKLIKSLDKKEIDNDFLVKVSKYEIVKKLIKEYKSEYKKSSWGNKKIGVNGIFDNKLFCSVIQNKISKYVNCNKFTKKKYNHMVAFLNEFLQEMENSKDPLKTLNHKLKLYEKYKKTEVVNVNTRVIDKVDILKDILKEYNQRKKCVREM